MEQNDIRFFYLYGSFLRDVINSKHEKEQIIKRYSDLRKKHRFRNLKITKNFLKDKYDQNSNAIVITCSGNKKNMGEVLEINDKVTKILGFY